MTNLEKLTSNWTGADNEYKSTIFKQALFLLTAELAIIGFLLQNDSTQKLMGQFGIKVAFLASMTTVGVSIVSSVVYKKYQRGYAKNTMHVEQYDMLNGKEVHALGVSVTFNDSGENKIKYAKEAINNHRASEVIFTIAETALCVSVLAGVVFVFLLMMEI